MRAGLWARECSRILNAQEYSLCSIAPNETQRCAILTTCSRRLSTFQVSKLLISDLRTFLVLWFLRSPVLHSRFSGTHKFLHVALRERWESYDFLPKHSKVTIVSKSCASCLEMVVVEGRSLPRKSGNPCKSLEFLRWRRGGLHTRAACMHSALKTRASFGNSLLRFAHESLLIDV